MNKPVAAAKSRPMSQADFFPLPVFQVPVPEMEQYHSEVIDLFDQKLAAGELGPHTNGYGYQSKTNLFDTNSYPQPYFREVLLAAFHHSCSQILSNTISDFSPDLPHNWVNTFNTGWAVLQTEETWSEEIPWHTHLPAMLSGCYYVSTSASPTEGNIQFTNPMMPNIFQPKTAEVEPSQGHILIFPSFLNHRPTATPSGGPQNRLALCMDGHWTSHIGEPDFGNNAAHKQ